MKKKFKKLTTLLLSGIIASTSLCTMACDDNKANYAFPEKVSVYETTGTKSSLLGRKSSISFTDFEQEDYDRQTVYVDTEKLYQDYVGYGASLTHASAYLLCRADETTREEILNDLFSRNGANFTLVRIPLGASDYVPGDEFFTCDDMPDGKTDENLEHFTLEHDQDILTIAKRIKEINPNVKFMASPWSAPAWMKKNLSLTGKGYLADGMIPVYSNYLVKFVSEYAKQGINFNYLTICNEPNVPVTDYPAMEMTSLEAAQITAETGKKLKEQGFNTDIVAWDFNYGSSSSVIADEFMEALWGNEEENEYAKEAKKYSSAVGLHGYDGDGYFSAGTQNGLKVGIEKAVREYNKSAFITEITEHSGATDFAANMTYACKNIVVNPCAVQTNEDEESWNGCSGAMFWNFVLDSNGEPTPVGHSTDCYGVISLDKVTKNDTVSYKYSKLPSYYAMAHVQKFMYDVDGKPCRALKATTEYADLAVMAYYRNDGAVIVVVCNANETNSAELDVVIKNKKISYAMKPQSVVTFVC